ncbi:DUF84 family protein [Virgibacillus kekensis]|uniref:inosine/xanthosine triphosphatase n=1 Tax=Virgibacillus kekensis TaxID=202261 RepID=A0ABV9DD90_9BACI
MKVRIGSQNPAKIQAAQEVFSGYEVEGMDASSNVSAQPTSDAETKKGAINRARNTYQEGDLGLGLEGGVMTIEGQLYLCNWGALMTDDQKILTASGARILLPEEFSAPLQGGLELGDIMDNYTERQDVRSKEGAIGVFTNDQVSRKEMFAHVIKLLYGQWEYSKKK